jgi:hypothetical protein
MKVLSISPSIIRSISGCSQILLLTMYGMCSCSCSKFHPRTWTKHSLACLFLPEEPEPHKVTTLREELLLHVRAAKIDKGGEICDGGRNELKIYQERNAPVATSHASAYKRTLRWAKRSAHEEGSQFINWFPFQPTPESLSLNVGVVFRHMTHIRSSM